MATKARRKRYTLLSRDTWQHIRQLYESGTSPAELCRRFRISQSTLFSRRRREGWCPSVAPVGDSCTPGLLTDPTIEITSPSGECRHRPGQDPESSSSTPIFVAPELVTEGEPKVCPPGIDGSRTQYRYEVTQDHLRMARDLRARIEELTHDLDLGAGTHGRRSRAAVDLATATEKLQKIERSALGMDRHDQVDRPKMVIVVPAKLSETEWTRAAKMIRPGGADTNWRDKED